MVAVLGCGINTTKRSGWHVRIREQTKDVRFPREQSPVRASRRTAWRKTEVQRSTAHPLPQHRDGASVMSSPLAALPLHGSGLRGSSSAPPSQAGVGPAKVVDVSPDNRRALAFSHGSSLMIRKVQPEANLQKLPPTKSTRAPSTTTLNRPSIAAGREVHPPTVSPSLPLSDGGSGRRRRARSSESPPHVHRDRLAGETGLCPDNGVQDHRGRVGPCPQSQVGDIVPPRPLRLFARCLVGA